MRSVVSQVPVLTTGSRDVVFGEYYNLFDQGSRNYCTSVTAVTLNMTLTTITGPAIGHVCHQSMGPSLHEFI